MRRKPKQNLIKVGDQLLSYDEKLPDFDKIYRKLDDGIVICQYAGILEKVCKSRDIPLNTPLSQLTEIGSEWVNQSLNDLRKTTIRDTVESLREIALSTKEEDNNDDTPDDAGGEGN